MRTDLLLGDCVEKLKELEENSVDCVVTDPPYELGFMGKSWDNKGIAYSIDLWKEVFRVLKPGGHLLSFGGTRTYHRMACAIEDAGFEIRDCLQWLYGSGFPKSLNIGKQVDKIQGNEREFVGYGKLNPRDKKHYIPNNNSNFNASQSKGIIHTKGNSVFEGQGTALKPANEPVVLARKPLSEKNVALNVLKWGTGGLNIDACRIGIGDRRMCGKSEKSGETSYVLGRREETRTEQGRFPANVILDEESGRLLDEQSGISKSNSNPRTNSPDKASVYGKYDKFTGGVMHSDVGGASRFFYCAKSSKSERNKGLEGFEEKNNDVHNTLQV